VRLILINIFNRMINCD